MVALAMKLLQLPSEESPPFKYLGVLDDFNGLDVQQFNDYISIKISHHNHHHRARRKNCEDQTMMIGVANFGVAALRQIAYFVMLTLDLPLAACEGFICVTK